MRRVLLILLIVATLIFLSASWGYAREFFAVDSCLDGSGSFDYSAMVCDHTQNHPFIPYTKRHPGSTSIAIIAGTIAICALAGFVVGGSTKGRV